MKRGTLGVVALAAIAAACSDPTGSTGDRMTRAEALLVADGIATSGEHAYNRNTSEATQSGTASAEPLSITIDHTSSHPCPVSGRVALALMVDLELDGEAQSLDYAADGSLTHEACAFTKDGVTLTVDGDPNLEFHARLTAARGDAGPYTADVSGALDWSASDERTGRCVIDLEAVTDFMARRRTLEGEVCGHTIDQTITWN